MVIALFEDPLAQLANPFLGAPQRTNPTAEDRAEQEFCVKVPTAAN
jgi:hypothetical protein